MKKNNQSEKKYQSSIRYRCICDGEPAPFTCYSYRLRSDGRASWCIPDERSPYDIMEPNCRKADYLISQGRPFQIQSPARSLQAPVIVCVLDYNVVHEVLGPVGDALKGRTLVNLTADSPKRAREMATWAAQHGVDYLDGAIMTPTPTIGTPAASVLYSGPESIFKVHQPTLASLGGTTSYLGADPGRAAAYDVALLDLFWTSMSGYAHARTCHCREYSGKGVRYLCPVS